MYVVDGDGRRFAVTGDQLACISGKVGWTGGQKGRVPTAAEIIATGGTIAPPDD